jgi:hypothetical protein
VTIVLTSLIVLISLFGIYFGDHANKFGFSQYLVVNILLILQCLFISDSPKWRQKYYLLLFTVLISAIFFEVVEFIHYPNYVYSHWHIIPENVCFLSANLFALWYLNIKKTKSKIALISSLIIMQLFVISTIPVFARSLSQFYNLYNGIHTNMADQLHMYYGPRYEYFEFVKAVTPPNSRIQIPPEILPWRYTGNHQFMGAWLYPRQIDVFSRINSQPPSSPDYIIISSEEDGAPYKLWPDFPIQSDLLYVYDFENHSYSIYHNVFYRPQDWSNKKIWGLIIPTSP